MISFRVPFPPKELNPNKRQHWAQKYKHERAHKNAVSAVCIQERLPRFIGPVDVSITFHPPDNRKRDMDNMVASFKWGQDTIAERIGVDDADWRVTYERGEVVKGGLVTVAIKGREYSQDPLVTIPLEGTIGGGE